MPKSGYTRVPYDVMYCEWKNVIEKSGKMPSGALKLEDERARAEELVFRYYESVRHMKIDCQKIKSALSRAYFIL